MKFKCFICGKEVETNDYVFELQINISIVNNEELGDYVHSPIYSEKICSGCAEHIGLIIDRGIKNLNKK